MTFPFPTDLLDENEAWGFPAAPRVERLELELVDDETNARRFYRMITLRPDPVQLALFAEPPPPAALLIVERGRMNESYVRDEYSFAGLAPLAAKWRQLLGARQAHRYRITRRL